MADLLGVEDRENGGMAASYWNSVEQTWTGRQVLRDEVLEERSFKTESCWWYTKTRW